MADAVVILALKKAAIGLLGVAGTVVGLGIGFVAGRKSRRRRL